VNTARTLGLYRRDDITVTFDRRHCCVGRKWDTTAASREAVRVGKCTTGVYSTLDKSPIRVSRPLGRSCAAVMQQCRSQNSSIRGSIRPIARGAERVSDTTIRVERATPVIHQTMRAARTKPQASDPDELSAPTGTRPTVTYQALGTARSGTDRRLGADSPFGTSDGSGAMRG
jgi:hypothetical protein